jgi:linoleoyl-CoA desaturase
MRPLLAHIARKVWRQVLKDYVLWPGAAALVALPISLWVNESPLLVFALVAAANATANVIRNVWAFVIIFCGHFPEGVINFTKEQVEGETRSRWYLRQLLGSCNIGGGKLFHVMSGNLSHQIEQHLFPGHVAATGIRRSHRASKSPWRPATGALQQGLTDAAVRDARRG